MFYTAFKQCHSNFKHGEATPEDCSAYRLSLHRSSRQVWQNFTELSPTTNEATLEITGRLDLSDGRNQQILRVDLHM